MRRSGIYLGTVLAQPQKLGRLHLGRDAGADIFQHLMALGVDTLGLFDGAMVHPDDDVTLRVDGIADGQRRLTITPHDQRAGGIETDARDLRRVDPGTGHAFPDRVADRAPDLLAGLFGDDTAFA